jgi:D-aspartate ligase
VTVTELRSVGSASADVDVSTPAVVLKFDPNVMHHGGLGAIRSLGRLGISVYGVHEGAWAPAAQSRYLHGRIFWRPSPDDVQRVRSGLQRLADRLGRPAVLIATDDVGAIFLAEHGDPLRGQFLFPAPPPALPRQLADKYSMHLLCRELGIPTPHSTLPGSMADAREFAAMTGFPLIAKLASPQHGGKKLRSTSIIAGQHELAACFAASQHSGAALMLQEYVPSRPGHDWFFHGYCRADSVCEPACTGVKDRSYPAHAGLTSLGHWAANDALQDQVTGMLARLGYRGIMDLDLRHDLRDGQYKLLDFNPRLGAQFRLFRDSAGLDVVRAAYLDLTGQPGGAGEPVLGRKFLVENYDPISSASYWRSGEVGLRAWLASLRGVDEAAWFAADDLRPFGLMCLRMAWRALSRPFATEHGNPAGRTARQLPPPRISRGRAAGRAGPGSRAADYLRRRRPAGLAAG